MGDHRSHKREQALEKYSSWKIINVHMKGHEMIHRLVKSKTASLIFFTCFMVVVHIGQTWADESATTAPRQDAVVQQKDSTGIDQENQDSGKMQENHPSDMKGKSPDEISGMSDEKIGRPYHLKLWIHPLLRMLQERPPR